MFRKTFSLVIMLALLLGLMPFSYAQTDALAPDSQPNQIYYAPFPVDITLDGSIDDWDGVPRVILSGNSHSVTFAAAGNGEYLYVLGDVTDPNIISGEHDANYWNEDSLEIYINATGNLTQRSYTDGVVQITIPALNKDLPSEEAILAGVRGATAEAQVSVTETENGYRVEMAVPLQNEVWSITPEHGAVIGFQVHLNGATESSRDTKLIWSAYDTSDQSYQNPSVFGFLMFYEIGQTDIPDLPETEVALPELPDVPRSALYRSPYAGTEARIMDLMQRMTLDEKIAQMTLVEKGSIAPEDITTYGIGGILSGGGGYPSTGNTPEEWAVMVDGFQAMAMESRLGIPMIYGVDAVHGHNNVYGATVFPHNVGLGATRNPQLVEDICRATALEMIATGIYWDYAPVVAVGQDIRWGRIYEVYGEQTDLVIELSMACMRGLQGDDLADPLTVLATPKHFVGDGGAVWGTSTSNNYIIDRGVTEVDEETLRAIHLPPYEAAIENGAQSIMVSFSSWGGMKMHAQHYLITEVLKGELGFEGFIVSDWAGTDEISPDYYEATVTSINAGVDMVMVPYDYYRFMDTMKAAVASGDIPIERVDDAVRRILTVKFDMGLFENPYSNPELLAVVGSEEHRALARQAVVESQVLLKNEGDVLPLSPEIDTIFVAGRNADDIGIQSGGWTIEWQGRAGDIIPGTTILEGIQNTVSPETEVVYSEDGEFEGTASVGILVIGELPYAEGVGDNGDLTLSNPDLQTIENMRGSVDQLIVVIVSGRPLIITDYLDDWDAVVAAWLPGSEGQGVADVLFGSQPFTGKLSLTWPRSIDQLPLGTASEEEVLFPLGFGLTTEATQAPAEASQSEETAAEAEEATVANEAHPVNGDVIPLELVLDDFENGIFMSQDSYHNGLGLVPWGDSAENVVLATQLLIAHSALALPHKSDMPNNILSVEYNITGWGGFTHVLTDGENWIIGDWTAYNALSLWLYGNDSSGVMQLEIFDNRAAGSTGDSAERWYYHIPDDFVGWRQFTIPFDRFQRRTDWQPNDAPDDGLGLDQVSGYAIGYPVGVGAFEGYVDEVGLTTVEDTSVVNVASGPMEEVFEVDTSIGWDTRAWALVWSDEFEGEAGTPINAEFWTCEIGGNGWGNNELEYYTDRVENVALDGNSNLAITARQETLDGSTCHYGECQYTSARCITKDKVEFSYGRVEARIRVPYGQGIWPAFWMLGANFPEVGWPNSGEIDILEYIGKEPRTTYSTIHGPGYSGGNSIGAPYAHSEDVADDFHVFAIDWDPDAIRWYVDGELVNMVTPNDLNGREWVYDHDFFLLLNVAVGGNWPGYPDETSEFPQTMLIDYVRVYKLAE